MHRKKPIRSTQRVRFSFVKIHTGSDLSRRRLPLMALESSVRGPTVWLTACGHGDEVGGMVIVQELFKLLRKRPLLRGSLHAFPLMNPTGFETASRYIVMSKEDLNRSFPGAKNGSLAERIADKIFTTIRETKPTLVLDLHNDWMNSIPYTLIDPKPDKTNKQTYEKVKTIAEKSGFFVINDTEIIQKSFTYNLLEQNIPALTIELGESYIVNETNVQFGVKSILGILNTLGMFEIKDKPFRYEIPETISGKSLRFANEPVSSASGIIRFYAKPGDMIKKGQPVAKIYNTFGKLQDTVVSKHDGIVLGHSDSSVAYPGAPIMAFGVI